MTNQFKRRALTAIAALAWLVISAACGAARPDPAADRYPPVRLIIDYSAAEELTRALGRNSISKGEVRALLRNRGISAMVKKVGVYFPPGNKDGLDGSPDGFVRAVMAAVSEKKVDRSPFDLASVRSSAGYIHRLIAQIRADEPAIKARLIRRVAPLAPRMRPAVVTLHFVVGGASDGFVLDDDPNLALFVKLNKPGGDLEGTLEDSAHELYHVLQKASGSRSPGYVNFVTHLRLEPAIQRIEATTLWEGTANLAVDSRLTKGRSPYVRLLRDRYIRNQEPHRLRQSFAMFGRALKSVAAGRLSWDEVENTGFSDAWDERFYHVGMAMAGALYHARGRSYFEEIFTRPPSKFFGDYIALSHKDPKLPKFDHATELILLRQSASWAS